MRLLDEITKALEKLDSNELAVIYEHIRLIEKMKSRGKLPNSVPSIEEIHEMTASSESSWSESVIHDREERI